MSKNNQHTDIIIVGAGLSGIGAGHYIQERCPNQTYTILEMRDKIGGTWDLFKYPGIRSDSDMYTFGYAFRPWKNDKAISDGASILQYIQDAAAAEGIDKKIQYNRKVVGASWSSDNAQWTIETKQTQTGEIINYTCNFLFMCSGYYNYDSGYTPNFKGKADFKGEIVHPQKWTKGINYKNKKVVIIGSGATAVTLVPALAKEATSVTMLQRSPTYVISRPAKDGFANFMKKILPIKLAYSVIRWKNVLLGLLFYKIARSKPKMMKQVFINGVKKELGENYDVEKHFTPSYNPWDQRLCLVPDGDLFRAIKKGKAKVVTEHIEKFTEKGIALKSGEELEADLIVTATGLRMELVNNMDIIIDGKKIAVPESYVYRGMMLSDIPNLAFSTGYTNASWTLKTDLVCQYICRLLNHMKKTGATICTPRLGSEAIGEEPLIDFSSGYVKRALKHLPKQGTKSPWKLHQNYILDVFNFRYGSIKDDALEYK